MHLPDRRPPRLPRFAVFAMIVFALAAVSSAAFAQGFNAVYSRDGVDVWAVGDAGRVWRSLDSGATWSSSPLGAIPLRDVAARGFTVLAVGDAGKVWRSTNSGGAFASSTLGGAADLRAVAIAADDAAWIVGKGGAIWKSVDGGASWSPQTSGTALDLNAVRFRDASNGWAAGAAGTVLHTIDGGANWSPANVTTANDLLSIDAIGSDVWVCGKSGSAWKSSTAGGAWTPLDLKIDSKGDVTAVWMDSASQITLTGGGGFIRSTTDGGTTWTFATHPLLAATSDYFAAAGGKAWAVSPKTTAVVRTSNGGTTWSLATGATTTYTWNQKLLANNQAIRGNSFHTVPGQNRDRVFAVMGGQVYKSWNRGDTWTAVGIGIPGGSGVRTYSFYCSPKDSTLWVAATKGGSGTIYRTTTSGGSWATPLVVGFTEYGMPLEMNPDKPDTLIFAPEDGRIYISPDFGLNWSVLSNPGFRSPCDIIISPENNANIVVGDGVTSSSDPAHIFQSENGGTAFSDRYTGASSETPTLGTSRLLPSTVFATNWSSGGVWRSTDFGKNWAQIHTSSSAWGIYVAPDDPKLVLFNRYAGTPNYISTDGGSLNSFTSTTTFNPFVPGGPGPGSGYAVYALDRSTMLDMHSGGIYKLDVAYTVPTSSTQNVTVTSPNGGEVWPVGAVRNVTWTATGIGLVRIEYQRGPVDPWVLVADVEGYAGTYAWTIPNDPTNTAKLRVTDVADGSPVDVSNANFSISGPHLNLTQLALAYGAHPIGSATTDTVRITNSGNANLTISSIAVANPAFYPGRAGGILLTPGQSDTIGVTFAPGSVAAFADTLYLTNDGGPAGRVAVSGTGTSSSILTVLAANGGEAWQAGKLHNLTWSSTGIADVALDYRTAEAEPWTEIIASTPAAAGSYAWLVPFTPTAAARVRIREVGGGVLDVSDGLFSITTSAFGASPDPFEIADGALPGDVVTDTLVIQNKGNATLSITGVSSDNATFWPVRIVFDIPPGGRDTLGVSFEPGASGPDSALFTFSTDDFEGTHAVRVRGIGSSTVSTDPVLPLEFALGRTQPNPFAREARIPFALPHGADVTLEVFNLQGQRVATLVRGFLPAGQHSAAFRPSASGGAAGVYFVRMRAETFERTQKIVHFAQ